MARPTPQVSTYAVQTTDAKPNLSPHKISDKPGEDRAHSQVWLYGPGLTPGVQVWPGQGVRPSPAILTPGAGLQLGHAPGELAAYRYYSLRVSGSGASSGVLVHEQGVLCGVTRCGTNKSQRRRWMRGPAFDDALIEYDEVGLPDGDYPVRIWIRHDTKGWV